MSARPWQQAFAQTVSSWVATVAASDCEQTGWHRSEEPAVHQGCPDQPGNGPEEGRQQGHGTQGRTQPRISCPLAGQEVCRRDRQPEAHDHTREPWEHTQQRVLPQHRWTGQPGDREAGNGEAQQCAALGTEIGHG